MIFDGWHKPGACATRPTLAVEPRRNDCLMLARRDEPLCPVTRHLVSVTVSPREIRNGMISRMTIGKVAPR